MAMFDSFAKASRAILELGRGVPLALKPVDVLISPGAQQESRRFQNFRARLAQVQEDRVRRVLTLLMGRAVVDARRGNPSLLRSLPDLAPTRALAVWIAPQAAGHDPDFKRWVAQGDRARDAGNWTHGVNAYLAALNLYRQHAGYRVQLGHCLKESGRTVEAEICYRDAVALGGAIDHIWPHLEFVAHRNGGSVRLYPPHIMEAVFSPLGGAEVQSGLATSCEIRALAWLLHGVESPATPWLLQVLRAAPLREQVKQHLIADPAFINTNGSLIALAGMGSRG